MFSGGVLTITNTEFRPDTFDPETNELSHPRFWIVWFTVVWPNGSMSSNIYLDMDENATVADFEAFISNQLGL